MGFLDTLLGRDPRRDLANAEELLTNGAADKALRLLERFTDSRDPGHRERVARLRKEAAEVLFADADRSARRSHEEGLFEDAAEWLRSTLELPLDDSIRAEVEQRICKLEDAAAAQERRGIRLPSVEPDTGPDSGTDTATDQPIHEQLSVDEAFDLLIGTLEEDLLELYEYQNEEFRQAYVDLNEGRLATAGPMLEKLAEKWPKDPAIRFERGRCRLSLGDREGARLDFETVWESFGDETIDRGGRISVPGLWADAMLGLGRTEELVERLDGVADPRHGDPELCQLFAEALIAETRFERARDFLTTCAVTFPAENGFNRLLALVYVELGERERAIAGLESTIAPACVGGCGAPSLDSATLRALISLYLDQPEAAAIKRSKELLEHLSHARGGRFGLIDLDLLERYHYAAGDSQAAAGVAATRKELEALGTESSDQHVALPSLAGAAGQRKIL